PWWSPRRSSWSSTSRRSRPRPASPGRTRNGPRKAHRDEPANAKGGAKVKILAMSGSLRAAANTRVVLAAALEAIRKAAKENGATAEIDVYEGIGELPIFNEEIERPVPDPVLDLRERIEAADALLIVTPEYNASIPG